MRKYAKSNAPATYNSVLPPKADDNEEDPAGAPDTEGSGPVLDVSALMKFVVDTLGPKSDGDAMKLPSGN